MTAPTDEKTRVRIAEIMGLEIFNPCGIAAHCKCHIESLPNFLNDLDAAFQAVEWLREKGWTPVLIAESYDSVWEVTLRKDGHMDVYAVNESLPRAICEAFLKATEETK